MGIRRDSLPEASQDLDSGTQTSTPRSLRIQHSEASQVGALWLRGQVHHLNHVNKDHCPSCIGRYQLAQSALSGIQLRADAINAVCTVIALLLGIHDQMICLAAHSNLAAACIQHSEASQVGLMQSTQSVR